jgi:DNA-binding response OmpR family regulator
VRTSTPDATVRRFAAYAALARDAPRAELGSADIFEFARFRFDRRGHCLYRLDNARDPVLLTAGRTTLDILGLLVERPGEVVESDEIRRMNARYSVHFTCRRRSRRSSPATGSCRESH